MQALMEKVCNATGFCTLPTAQRLDVHLSSYPGEVFVAYEYCKRQTLGEKAWVQG